MALWHPKQYHSNFRHANAITDWKVGECSDEPSETLLLAHIVLHVYAKVSSPFSSRCFEALDDHALAQTSSASKAMFIGRGELLHERAWRVR